jgi:hypothetical protein
MPVDMYLIGVMRFLCRKAAGPMTLRARREILTRQIGQFGASQAIMTEVLLTAHIGSARVLPHLLHHSA